jgi:hypothetical protein
MVSFRLYSNKTVPMKTVCCLLFCFFSFNALQAQQSDTAVSRVFGSNLKVISDYLGKKETSLAKISDAIVFFTDLTGIASESDGKYYGQFHPTQRDLNAWTAWYFLNKDYIMWDKEIKTVVLYKKVKPVIMN